MDCGMNLGPSLPATRLFKFRVAALLLSKLITTSNGKMRCFCALGRSESGFKGV